MKKSFLEYLFEEQEANEKEDIDESSMSGDDFAKRDYEYLRAVIQDMLLNKKIGLGNKTMEREVKIDKKVLD